MSSRGGRRGYVVFFFSSRRRHTRYIGDWSSDVCSSDLGTPAPIIQRLNTEVVGILNELEVKERLKQQGIDADPGTPAQLAAHIKSEVARFDTLIKAIGLKVE